MLDVSARALGEAEEPELEPDADKRAKQEAEAAKQRRWEEVGQPIKAQMREDILFSLMPEHERAAHIYLNGWPEEKKVEQVKIEPLTGMSQSAARAIMALIDAKTFSDGAWARSRLWEQLQADGQLGRKRLEALAEG